MRKFKRHRTIEELKAACARRGWTLETDKHDKEGSDYVSFDWSFGTHAGTTLFNTFNGQFFGHLSTGEHYTSQNTAHEKERWFKTLLTVCFV